jgi:hypothetical protein
MEKKVAQLKLFLESIAEYDEELVSKVQDAVGVIFEGEEGESAEDMEVFNKVKGLIAGGYEDLPPQVKEKVAARKGVTVEQIDKAVAMWKKKYPSEKEEFEADMQAKLAKAD